MGSRVLVISPHPDDEAIGCGGALHKHVVDGDHVGVIFLTSGEKGGHGKSPEETRCLREREAEDAASVLGIQEIDFWRERDGMLRSTSHLTKRLAATLDTYRPDRIYTTSGYESHPDHRAAARLTHAARRTSEMPCLVFSFEVWTPLERIDEITDITPYIDVKLAAIRAYQSQCKALSFDEAFLGLARYRGEMFCWPKEEGKSGRFAEVFAAMRC